MAASYNLKHVDKQIKYINQDCTRKSVALHTEF